LIPPRILPSVRVIVFISFIEDLIIEVCGFYRSWCPTASPTSAYYNLRFSGDLMIEAPIE
jgi:hypothetical protein